MFVSSDTLVRLTRGLIPNHSYVLYDYFILSTSLQYENAHN